MVIMNLPEQYTYITVENDENNTTYRVKELTSGFAAEVSIYMYLFPIYVFKIRYLYFSIIY